MKHNWELISELLEERVEEQADELRLLRAQVRPKGAVVEEFLSGQAPQTSAEREFKAKRFLDSTIRSPEGASPQ